MKQGSNKEKNISRPRTVNTVATYKRMSQAEIDYYRAIIEQEKIAKNQSKFNTDLQAKKSKKEPVQKEKKTTTTTKKNTQTLLGMTEEEVNYYRNTLEQEKKQNANGGSPSKKNISRCNIETKSKKLTAKTKPSLIRRFIDYNKRKEAEMRAEVEAYEAEEEILDAEARAKKAERKKAREDEKLARKAEKQARKATYKEDKKVNVKGIAYAAMAVGLAGLVMMGVTHPDQVQQGLEDGIQTVGDKVATAIVDHIEENKEKQKEETMYNLTYENMDESTRENYSSRVEKLLESIEENDGYEFDYLSEEELIEGYAKILERESSMIENTFKSYFNKVATDGDQELLEKIVSDAFRRRCI